MNLPAPINLPPSIKGAPQHCVVKYPFASNGPWNYSYESPPPDVKFIYFVGLYLGEDEKNFLCASDYMELKNGSIHPIHVKRFQKGFCELRLI